ncbi:DUF4153 domain-containing protein [Clostridium tagluense]|uniref:DUF4153 domain-containing protein n=1 Tax=Clostridium tagluense TaxID=360422 RepID=UPI001C6E8476|nr:DUF4153 domain-containing protein [Clostridium tagluense]MBW9156474.1 DUF4153 domain-containing protein [Clostridium tagluense]WLC64123.1 DUF4153 domain-containing protein [Clostridium tagluense]
MKKIFNAILKGIVSSINRFPQTIGISTACVILLIYISEVIAGTSGDFIETLRRITMIVALGIPLSLCINLFFEGLETYKKVSLYASYLGGTVLLIFYYYFFLKDIGMLDMVSMSRYIAFSLILYLIFLFISYLPNRENFEIFAVRVFTRFFTTVLYSLVLYLGLAAILFTIDRLLGINIKGELYYYAFLIVVGIFAPAFFLAGLPTKNEILSLKDYSRLLNVLVLYIIMPLISIYTIILYIYFGKIIITRQWPEGLVSHLVLWYSVISSAVLFFISPLLHEKTWPKRYMKYFPKAIFPLIVMMFISIGIRINAYGVTENRYFVVALGIWAFLVMIYFATTKKLRNIMLPLSLAVITFISVFGPFSSYPVSKYSQNKRLAKIFIANNMIKDSNVIKASAVVSSEDSRQISSILNYFDRNHSLKDIKGLPLDFKISDMERIMGVKYTDEYNTGNNGYFYFNSLGALKPIDIKGYDYLFDSRNSRQQSASSSDFSIYFDYESSVLKMAQDGKDIYAKDLMDFATKLMDKYGINPKNQATTQEEMLFEDENSKVKIKIQFSNLSGKKNTSSGKIESKNFEFYVLVKLK